MMKCPKCGRELEQSGETTVAGRPYAVYQCGQCLVPLDLGGESIDVALTFAVAPTGEYVDAADPSQRFNLN